MFPSRNCLTVACVTSLYLTVNCMGGQSGDDGDFVEGPGGAPLPTDPALPEHCDDGETRVVEVDEPTIFESTPSQLVAGLAQPATPLHWVEYSSANLTASHSPGPGSSELRLAFSPRTDPADLRADEAIVETVRAQDPGEGDCPKQAVVIPVWVDADTNDGAIDAHFKGELTFYGRETATLRARLQPTEIGGTFALDAPVSKNPNYTWSLSAYDFYAMVWNGGSRGMLSPEFRATTGNNMGGDVAVAPPPALPPGSSTNGIFVPESWEAVAVWPRLEQCPPGIVVDMDDPILGRSAADVVNEFTEHGNFALELVTNVTSVDSTTMDVAMTFEAPSGLVCVNVSQLSGTLELPLQAHLTSNTEWGLNADLDVTVRGRVDLQAPEAHFARIEFSRFLDEAATSSPRSNFESSTGISLQGTPDTYADVWWTWFGDVTRNGTSLQTTATLLVTSPNPQQTAEIDEQIAAGGPGYGISVDGEGKTSLPGDVLLEATLVREP